MPSTTRPRGPGPAGPRARSARPSSRPIYPDLHYDPGTTTYNFDLAEANKELDAAGYPKGSNGIRVGKDGKPINLRLFARAESASSKQAIAFLAGWLKDVGIASTTKIVANDTLTQIIGQGNYDIFQWGWVGRA